MLHTVNKSPAESNKLENCLQFVQPGHAVLLLENAVYAALKDSEMAAQLLDLSPEINVYVLIPDLAARGLQDKAINPEIKQIGYPDFVRLATENEIVQSW